MKRSPIALKSIEAELQLIAKGNDRRGPFTSASASPLLIEPSFTDMVLRKPCPTWWNHPNPPHGGRDQGIGILGDRGAVHESEVLGHEHDRGREEPVGRRRLLVLQS